MRLALLIIALMLPLNASAETAYYRVKVTRKAQDLYEVAGSGMRLKTMACFEYAEFSDATLALVTYFGLSTGEITFVGNGGAKCHVKEVLR